MTIVTIFPHLQLVVPPAAPPPYYYTILRPMPFEVWLRLLVRCAETTRLIRKAICCGDNW